MQINSDHMADSKIIEQNILSYWKAHDIYAKVKLRNSQGPKYYFCDGPPYATGQIHPGTAWNKCIKDSVLRFLRSNGYNVRDQPGYDTHGLPIEVKVEKELKLNDKKEIEKLGVEKFISKCKEFATKHISVITSQFQRCGIWMDFDNPYITYHNSYIDATWKTIKAAEEKGLLYEGTYVVPYSPQSQTSLANYELEYQDRTDPSIYVKFKILGKENEYLIIWTTTPWTLIANKAVMVHPTFEYVKVQVDSEVWVIAKGRLEFLSKVLDRPLPVISEISGKKLENTEYEHPLQDKIEYFAERKVILSDQHVTLSDGSGLVHTAPGHGPEDYLVCKRYGIDPFCPVNTSGIYTEQAGDYAGKYVFDANDIVIQDLKDRGALVHSDKITHRYPHDWRKKTPLIYITAHQWFFKISEVKEKMISEIDNTINFHPDFAKTRFRDFVSSAPDWCISRQRYWGIPLPIWVCENKECKDRKVLGSKDELPDPNIDLHRPFIDEVEFRCEKCDSTMKRVPDILDVWFDSGNSVWAQMKEGEDWSKDGELFAEFIVEGKDQTRGWFYSLLGSGVVLNNHSPYKNLTMTGFFVTERGEKMSKSLGNFVPLEEIIEKYGADAFRLWSLSATTWDDLKFSTKELIEAKRTIDILANMGVWMNQFYKKSDTPIDPSNLEIEDRWLLSRTQNTIQRVTASFENYEPHDGLEIVRKLLVEDISRFYLKRLKQRMTEDKNPQAGLEVLYNCLLNAIQLLSAYAPFISEHLYLSAYKKYEKEDSISLLPWPKERSDLKDPLLEQQMIYLQEIINASANARNEAKIKLRWPVAELKVSTDSTEVRNAVDVGLELLKNMTNSQKVVLGTPRLKTEMEIHRSKVGAKFKTDSKEALEAIEGLKASDVAEKFDESDTFMVKDFEVDKDLVSINKIATGYSVADFDDGKVYVKTKIDKDLFDMAIEREISRRVQSMRKELSLVQTDKIDVCFSGDKKILDIAKRTQVKIASSINSTKLEFDKKIQGPDLIKDWDIEGMKLQIQISKAME